MAEPNDPSGAGVPPTVPTKGGDRPKPTTGGEAKIGDSERADPMAVAKLTPDDPDKAAEDGLA